MRLGDLFTGELSWRRLRGLIRQLPREAATVRAQHGEVVAWGEAEHLLAGIFDVLMQGNWQRAQAGNPKKVRRPKALRRPGDKPRGVRYGGTDLPADDVKRLVRSFDPTPPSAGE